MPAGEQCSLGLYMGPAWLRSHAQTLPHKGKRKIWASQQDLSWASFNTGDCFILDVGQRGGGHLSPLALPVPAVAIPGPQNLLTRCGTKYMSRVLPCPLGCPSAHWPVPLRWGTCPSTGLAVCPSLGVSVCPSSGHWGISLSIGMVGGWDVCPSIGVSLFPSRHLPGPASTPVAAAFPAWARWAEGHCGAVPSPLFHHSLPQPLMVWCGAWSNVLEHSRMQELVAASRDSEPGGKAHLEIVADGEEPLEMVQVCPHWAERGSWVSLGWLCDPPVSSRTPCRRAALRRTWWLTRAAQGQLSPTTQGHGGTPLMAPGLGIPKCHHGGHRRYMRLGTARVHHDSPPGVHEAGHGPGTIW